MRNWVTGGRLGLLGSVLLLGVPLVSHGALAAKANGHSSAHGSSSSSTRSGGSSHISVASDHHSSVSVRGNEHGSAHHSGGRASVMLASTSLRGGHGGGVKQAVFWTRKGHKGSMRYATLDSGSVSEGGISCVPFARQVSGIELTGNAATWWDEAAGQYARGSSPETGSVLNFRANSSMHLGHVAVVSSVISRREVEIEHANWWGPGASKGGISRNISVVDVSPNNDWTAVRVGLGHTGEYGSIYPTFGFIYARRDDGSMTRMAAAAPVPALNAAPRDLRSSFQRVHSTRSYDEVAEAPAGRTIDLSIGGFGLDAPDRRLK